MVCYDFSQPQEKPTTFVIDSCRHCLRLEQRFRDASEQYVSLIVQHDQMIRDGEPNASSLERPIQQAQLRRNAVGRLFLDHRINHAALSSAQDKNGFSR